MTIVAYFDGAATPNPGGMTVKFCVFDQHGNLLDKAVTPVGLGSNNLAEYLSLIALLNCLEKIGADEVTIRGDSRLIIEQVSGRWKVKEESFKPLCKKARGILEKYTGWKLQWCPREENLADWGCE
jgi:ribonuclease HI